MQLFGVTQKCLMCTKPHNSYNITKRCPCIDFSTYGILKQHYWVTVFQLKNRCSSVAPVKKIKKCYVILVKFQKTVIG